MAGQPHTRAAPVVRLPQRDGDPLARLLAADAQAAEAGRRLRALQRCALAGDGYDAAAYDVAVLAYRSAQREATAARAAWAQCRERSHGSESARAA